MCNLILSSIGPKGRYPLVSIAIPFIACGLFGWFFPSIFNWVYKPSPEQTANLSFLAFKFVLGVFFIAAFVHLPPVRTYLMAVPHNVRRLRQRRSMSRSAPDRSLSAFWGDRRGNFAILTALMMVPILFSAGLAVEYTLTLMQRQRMTNALDAAVLAAGREITVNPSISDDALKDYVEDVFIANLEIAGLNGSAFSLDENDIEIDRTNQFVTAKASHETALRLIRAASSGTHATLTTSNTTRAAYGQGQVEVALVIDTTSSMEAPPAGSQDLEYLEDIVEDVLDILLTDRIRVAGNVRVSLVPFSEGVNVGSGLAKYVFGDLELPRNYSPAYNSSVNPPLGYDRDQMETEFMTNCSLPSPVCQFVIDLADSRLNADDTPRDHCATERKQRWSGSARDYRFVDAHPAQQMLPRDSRLVIDACPETPIVPLTNNKNRLETAVATLTARSTTQVHTGIQWGWYMLSHNWRNHLPAASQPADHLDRNTRVRKVMIILSDGDTSLSYAYNDNLGNVVYKGRGMPRSEHYHRALCDAIKAQGVEIFGIKYNSNGDAMDWCVSPDTARITYLHSANTPAELEVALESIANTVVSELDLTQ